MTVSNYNWESELQGARDEYEDALFRIAMLEMEIEKTEQLLADVEAGKTNVGISALDREADQSRSTIYAVIDRHLRRMRINHFVRKTLPQAGLVAACVVAVLSIAAITALATSKTVRMKVFELLINTQKEYTELSLVESQEGAFDVPSDWAGEYYPSFIPEGFQLVETEGYPGWSEAFYQNEDAGILFFSEYESSSYANINGKSHGLG